MLIGLPQTSIVLSDPPRPEGEVPRGDEGCRNHATLLKGTCQSSNSNYNYESTSPIDIVCYNHYTARCPTKTYPILGPLPGWYNIHIVTLIQ